jgi:CheY-like chemotaxis protein
MDIRRRPDFRVIAEGDEAVGCELTLGQALALVDVARRRGMHHVAIVDDSTGMLVDEHRARTWVRRGPPPLPGDPTVPCPGCEDEGGLPTGDVLVQLPSGTWVRDTCDVCRGARRVHRDELARRDALVVDETPSPPPRTTSGTRARVARVLLVHHEPRFVEMLRLVLSDGFEVTSTTDAREALVWLMGDRAFDVVLCGVAMPFLSGVALRERVHAVSPALAARIVLLEKPVDVDALRELVRRRCVANVDRAAGDRGMP